jgi:tape measure domain-containing protein
MSSIKGMAAAYLSVQTIAKSINLASQVEDATIAFEVLTGRAKDGALIFEQIRQFAAESPITFSGATEAAKTMMSFGVAAQDVQKNLQMMSDVTGGNNERFKMLSLSFSQMSAAGRLMGQDLLQMINAGFNPLQQISKTTGESLIELKQRMEDGGISTEEVRQAFENATAEGGMFHGMTERLSETVSGKLNIALSDMEKKLSEAGEAMGPLIIQLLDAFNRVKPVLEAVVGLISKISNGIGYMIAVLSDTAATLKNFASLDFTEVRTATDKFLDDMEKKELERAQEALNQANNEFENKLQNVDKVALAEKRAVLEAAELEAKALEQQQKEQQKAAEDRKSVV